MISIVVLAIELSVVFLLRVLGLLSVDSSDATMFICCFSFAYAINVLTSKRLAKYKWQLLVAYFARIVVLLIDIFGRSFYILPHSGGDSEKFYFYSVRYAEGKPYWDTITVKVFGTIMKLFGTNRLLIQFLLMLTSIITIHVILFILDYLDVNKRGKTIAMWFVAIIPNYLILSTLFLRESLIAMFLAFSLLVFIYWWEGKNELFFFFAIALAMIGGIFHSGVVGVAFGYIGIRFLYDRRKNKYRLSLTSILIAIVSTLAIVYLFNNYASLLFGKMQNIESISDISSGTGRGESSYESIAGNSNTIFNFIIYSPLRIFLFLFTPLPFQIRGISDIIAMLFSAWCYLWIVARGLASSLKKTKNNTLISAIVIVIMMTSFVFGWGSTNIGTNIRHRDKMIPLFAVVLALSYEKRDKTKERIDADN